MCKEGLTSLACTLSPSMPASPSWMGKLSGVVTAVKRGEWFWPCSHHEWVRAVHSLSSRARHAEKDLWQMWQSILKFPLWRPPCPKDDNSIFYGDKAIHFLECARYIHCAHTHTHTPTHIRRGKLIHMLSTCLHRNAQMHSTCTKIRLQI